MSLIKWTPLYDPFNEMDRVMQNMMPSAAQLSLAVDVYEDDHNVYVETAMPGVDPDHVELGVEQNVLSIKGKIEHKSEVDEKEYYRREIRRGDFYRAISLPTHVDGGKAQAEFHDGMLKVTLPKVASNTATSIKINKK